MEQTRAFLDHVGEDRLYALFHLAVMTGLRRGEVVGLRWEDVDLERGTVRVVRQVSSSCLKVCEKPSDSQGVDDVRIQSQHYKYFINMAHCSYRLRSFE